MICAHIGIDKWFQLTPIHKDDEVQGEILVEMSIEQFGEVSWLEGQAVYLLLSYYMHTCEHAIRQYGQL